MLNALTLLGRHPLAIGLPKPSRDERRPREDSTAWPLGDDPTDTRVPRMGSGPGAPHPRGSLDRRGVVTTAVSRTGGSHRDEMPLMQQHRRLPYVLVVGEAFAEHVVPVERTATRRTHERPGRNRCRWWGAGRGWLRGVTVSAALMRQAHRDVFDARRCSLKGFPDSSAANSKPPGRRSRASIVAAHNHRTRRRNEHLAKAQLVP